MSKLESISDIIPRSFGKIDAAIHKKILCQELLSRWKEIFGEIAGDVEFVKVDDGVLTVTSKNSAVSDYVKYSAGEILDKINALLPADFISKIVFGRNFNQPANTAKKIPAPVTSAAEVELTAEEIAACERKAAIISDDTQRQAILDTLISHAKSEKSKLKLGWHKCAHCDVLVPPKGAICDICRVKERERLRKRIRRIFRDAPWTPFREVQDIISAEFPHMKAECTLETIESARMDLILQVAARVSYGDTTSDAAKFLVMLARQLPKEKLTLPIIHRTLQEFRYNLADRPPFSAHEFTKIPMARFNRIKKSAAQTE